MTDTALFALYKALLNRLSGSYPWGERVFADHAGSETVYPYVVYAWNGGGERNAIRQRADANETVIVKAVSTTLTEAWMCDHQIAALLNDHGKQDSPTDYLYAGSGWVITTITRENDIYLPMLYANVTPVYHIGARYRFIMEEL